MTANEFLMQANVAEKRMRKAALKVEILRSICEKITASLDGEAVSHTKNVNAHEDKVLRLIEAEEEYRQAKLAYAQIISNITTLLSKLEDDCMSNLLMLHYIKHKSLTDAAKQMYISRTSAYRYHQEALDLLGKMLNV